MDPAYLSNSESDPDEETAVEEGRERAFAAI
jgi:hypothetical protein